MKDLDDIKSLEAVDKSGMAGLINEYPEMMKEALEISFQKGFGLDKSGVRNIIIAGMGGSAISGDIVSKLMAGTGDVPVQVIRNYDLPKYAGKDTLVFILSYSGNTEETLSALDQAVKSGAKIIAMTSGGALKEKASSAGIPVALIRPGLPPRASTPYLLVPMLMVLEDLMIFPGARDQVKECISVLADMRLHMNILNVKEKNPAKKAASALKGKVPLIFGTPDSGDVASFRWKTQLSENSKVTSVQNVFPELDHNEIVNLGELKKGSNDFALVLLRDKRDSERMKLRADITRDLVSSGIENVFEIWAEGSGHLSRILSLCYFGDWVSLYLAVLNRTDPTPVRTIDRLKKELAG